MSTPDVSTPEARGVIWELGAGTGLRGLCNNCEYGNDEEEPLTDDEFSCSDPLTHEKLPVEYDQEIPRHVGPVEMIGHDFGKEQNNTFVCYNRGTLDKVRGKRKQSGEGMEFKDPYNGRLFEKTRVPFPHQKVFKDACERGDVARVLSLINDEQVNVAAKNNVAIRLAAEKGRLKVVEHLLNNGANPNEGTPTRVNALGGAAWNGHVEVVQVLLNHGANPSLDNELAIGVAAEQGHLKVVKLLLERGAEPGGDHNYAIRKAAEHGHLDVVNLLLDNEADPSANNNEAIRKAAKNRHTGVVSLLLEEGVKSNRFPTSLFKHVAIWASYGLSEKHQNELFAFDQTLPFDRFENMRRAWSTSGCN